MGWFSAVADVVEIAAPFLEIGADIGSAYITSQANEEAAERVAEASQRQADAIREGNRLAAEEFQYFRDNAAPAVQRLRQIAASDPGELTPSQVLSREDLRREGSNILAASGLRGAGRAGVATLQDLDRRYLAGAVDENIRRGDEAAALLANQGLSSASGLSRIAADTGRAESAAIGQAAAVEAGADTANAENFGTALGSISGVISNELKALGRERRSQKRPSEVE